MNLLKLNHGNYIDPSEIAFIQEGTDQERWPIVNIILRSGRTIEVRHLTAAEIYGKLPDWAKLADSPGAKE